MTFKDNSKKTFQISKLELKSANYLMYYVYEIFENEIKKVFSSESLSECSAYINLRTNNYVTDMDF